MAIEIIPNTHDIFVALPRSKVDSYSDKRTVTGIDLHTIIAWAIDFDNDTNLPITQTPISPTLIKFDKNFCCYYIKHNNSWYQASGMRCGTGFDELMEHFSELL